jgi:S-adenosyl methyltransferase
MSGHTVEVATVERPDWAPGGIDLDRPSVARIYDYWLGGSHNFAVDREVAEQTVRLMPDLPAVFRSNRAFLRRVVRHLVAAGVRQFLDLGSGIPTVGNVHEVAQRAAPDSRVVYVDIDPVAVAHSRALLAGNPLAGVVRADMTSPAEVLADPELRRVFDPDRPVAVLMVAVLHFIADDPTPIVTGYRDAMVPGSYLALSHGSHDGGEADRFDSVLDVYKRTETPLTLRSSAQIAAFFDGFDLIAPGLVRTPLWRPDPGEDPAAGPADANLAGLGRRR